MTLNQLFDSFGKLCADISLNQKCKQRDELLRQLQNIVGEKFARMEEKSTSTQNENSVLKERLFLKLIFAFLNEISRNRDGLRDINRTIEMNLFSFAKTRFKCLNSTVNHIDCCFNSPTPADRFMVLDQHVPSTRNIFEHRRSFTHIRFQKVCGTFDKTVLLCCAHSGQRRRTVAVRLHDRVFSRF
jgi:hypothetical protein